MIYLGFAFTFVFVPYLIYRVNSRVLGTEFFSPLSQMAIAAGVGPAIISLLLTELLRIIPGRPIVWYIVAVLSIITLVCIGFEHFVAQNRLSLTSDVHRRPQIGGRKPIVVLALIVVATMLWVSFIALWFPVVGPDPLHYKGVADILYVARDHSYYPFSTPWPETGFYSVSSHPLSYVSLIVWTYAFTGVEDPTLLMRIISPLYAVLTSLFFIGVFAGKNKVDGWLTAAILVTSPLYLEQASYAHIDTFRIFFIVVFIFSIYASATAPTIRNSIFSGLMLGLTIFAHSLGLLFIPIGIVLFYLFSAQTLSSKLGRILLILLVAVGVGGAQYIENIFIWGTPIKDDPVFTQIKMEEHLAHVRGISTGIDKIIWGVLQGYSKIHAFGSVYWLATIGLAALFITRKYKIKFSRLDYLVLLCVGGYLGGVGLTVMLGVDTLIKNQRYMLTIQPFIAYLAARSLASLADNIRAQSND